LAFTGEADGDEAGTALAVGDVDGDGLDDLLVGARGSDRSVTDGGAVYLLAGPLDASGDLGDADAIHEGVTLTARGADWTLTLADLDGDGVDDVFLADPLSGTTGGVEVFLDAAYGGDLDLATADVTLLGVDPGERAGSALALADFDGDGALDALVGAELASPGRLATGAVYVMAGLGTGTSDLSTADATLETTDTGSSIGDVVTAGDYDGDGVADVAVGDWWGGARAGRVYLLHGPFAGALSVASADATLEGETADAAAGWALATGDLDLDGADDLVVAAYGDDVYRGAVYLVLGGPGF
ncbi:MAG: FG-GAP repeat domain-containing protein, partial [Myxococcota bacterium]